MDKVTIVIPNWNGKEYLRKCLDSLMCQSIGQIPVIVVDNGSKDGSPEFVKKEYPWVRLFCMDQNYGFCKAVNTGIQAAETEYVILLNNDIVADRDFVKYLLLRAGSNPQVFSCQSKMLQMDRPDHIDNAGDEYCALGWAYTRGKDAAAENFNRAEQIFSSCGGAALYRRKVFEQTGLFDEAHFAYLEDVDIGYRAKICGYENWYEPKSVVYHKGSAATGSRHNAFKVLHSSRNTIYLIYKNMARWQILMNLPFLFLGCMVKFLYFLPKKLGHIYLKGIWQGILLSRKGKKFDRVPENFDRCWRIQVTLWRNMVKIFRKQK